MGYDIKCDACLIGRIKDDSGIDFCEDYCYMLKQMVEEVYDDGYDSGYSSGFYDGGELKI